MTTRDVMKHVRTVEGRMAAQLSKGKPKGKPEGKAETPAQPRRSHRKAADATDERERLAHDADERTDRAGPCLREGGPKPSEVC